jgi:enamine deaminase RidA (YjgF/YER057c/UK114 family)
LDPEFELERIGFKLPQPSAPAANYAPLVLADGLLFVSGHGPMDGNRPRYVGKVGRDVSLEEGYEAARLCALNCLGRIKMDLGSLDKVERILKVVGYVSSHDDFHQQSWVLDGASDLLMKIFGEKGRHARSAIGVNALSFNMTVEIEMLVKIKS